MVLTFSYLPMIASENQVAIPGKRHKRTMEIIISTTNGMTPQITSLNGISGAMFLITKILRPTGGWINPISITIVITTPNQIRSKPAALSGGRMIGAVIRMIETGGRKKPSTTTISRIAARRIQSDSCNSTIDCAADWLMCK